MMNRLAWVASIAVALALASPTLWIGFQLDDHWHRAVVLQAPTLHEIFPSRLDLFSFVGSGSHLHGLIDLGVLPWWTAPHLHFAFWRPLTALTHWLDYALWFDQPVLAHAHSLLWFALLLAAVAALYRRLLGPAWVATLATWLYALDNTHGFAVGWVATRNILVATLFGALAILYHDRWRRTGWQPGALFGPGCLLIGLLSGEAAIATLAYIGAHVVFLDQDPWLARWRALAPHAAVVAVWLAVYSMLGYGVSGATPVYIHPVLEPLQFIGAMIEHGPILLLAQWVGPTAQTYAPASPGTVPIHWLGGVGLLTLLAVCLAPLLAAKAAARFFCLGQLLAMVVACAATPDDRYLFFVGLGAMGLLAQWTCWLFEGRAGRPSFSFGRGLSIATAGALLIVHLVIAPVRLVDAAQAPARLGNFVEAQLAGFPLDRRIETQTIVVVNAPDPGPLFYLPFIRLTRHEPYPARTRLLASSPSVHLFRPGARTLVVRPADGYRTYYGPERMFPLGYRIPLAHTTIEVTALSGDGNPAEATVQFDVDLDDPSLRWLRWTGQGGAGRFVEMLPPEVGEQTHLDWAG